MSKPFTVEEWAEVSNVSVTTLRVFIADMVKQAFAVPLGHGRYQLTAAGTAAVTAIARLPVL